MSTKFLWCDTETTGLDPERDLILELGLVVTDKGLMDVASLVRVVGQSPADLERASVFVRDMHTKNGLFKDVKRLFAVEGFNIGLVEQEAIKFVQKHFPDPLVKPMLFGNTVGFDLGFLKKHMPKLAALLHYRTCDVSSFKPLAKAWFGLEYKKPEDDKGHRVWDDLKHSREELKFYRENMMPHTVTVPDVLMETPLSPGVLSVSVNPLEARVAKLEQQMNNIVGGTS